MSEPRLIDANEIVEVAERAWNAWNLAMATQDTNRGINKVLRRQELCKAVKAVAEGAPTIDPENLPIVRQLREELERVTKERDKAQRYEHLDELKLCLESSRDINLVYIPRSLAEKVAVEGIKIQEELEQIKAERDAAMPDGNHYHFRDATKMVGNIKKHLAEELILGQLVEEYAELIQSTHKIIRQHQGKTCRTVIET